MTSTMPALKEKYRAIYQPRGAALEYSPLAVNLYSGCPHGCEYCYVPGCLRKAKETFSSNFAPRKNIVNLIQRDLIDMRAAHDTRQVLFCFTCDPYPGECEDNVTTQKVLELFKAYNQPFQLLTKSGMKPARDFHLYKKTDRFAATLTFLSDSDSLKWEPGAALPKERVAGLRKAKEKGIFTWVSFEPVLDPEQVYKLYEMTKGFVDLYKVGKLNHVASTSIDWHKFGHEMIDRFERDGKQYIIKDALKKFL